MSPKITENAVPVRWPSGGRTLSDLSAATSGVSSASSCFQASVRSRNEMKNGAITRVSASAWMSGHFRAVTPMKYASG